MPTYVIHLTDEDVQRLDAYLRWHATHPADSFGRLVHAETLASVEEFLDALLTPMRAMLQQWWAQYPEAHPQEPPPDA